jgi:hypothetical protein
LYLESSAALSLVLLVMLRRDQVLHLLLGGLFLALCSPLVCHTADIHVVLLLEYLGIWTQRSVSSLPCSVASRNASDSSRTHLSGISKVVEHGLLWCSARSDTTLIVLVSLHKDILI